jgi:hypothetical protein
MSTAFPTPAPALQKPMRLAWLLVCMWFVGCLGALWSFELSASRPHEIGLLSLAEYRTLREAAERWQARRGIYTGSAKAAGPTVVRVVDPGCRCNAANDRHLAQIKASYAGQGVRIESVSAADLRRAPGLGRLGGAPLAMVFDARGNLAYLGPFSDDAVCGTGPRAGFVEQTLGRMERGEQLRASPVLARGCSCGSGAIDLESLT